MDKQKWNVLPLPTWLSTHSRPSSKETNWAEIASPSPVPPYRLLVDVSACENASKMLARLSSGMPMPVSRTAK